MAVKLLMNLLASIFTRQWAKRNYPLIPDEEKDGSKLPEAAKS